jgi:hypothetical protein
MKSHRAKFEVDVRVALPLKGGCLRTVGTLCDGEEPQEVQFDDAYVKSNREGLRVRRAEVTVSGSCSGGAH